MMLYENDLFHRLLNRVAAMGCDVPAHVVTLSCPYAR